MDWTAGTITKSNGLSYTIDAGTLVLTASHYIYLDPTVSTTVLQSSTNASDAVGGSKIYVAFAKINADTTAKAIFTSF